MLVLQLGELDTNWDGTFKMEVLLTECLYEFEKLMLEHVHDRSQERYEGKGMVGMRAFRGFPNHISEE